MGAAAVADPGVLVPVEVAALSQAALDRPLSAAVEVTVARIGTVERNDVLLGAFGRPPPSEGNAECTFARRGTGGAPVRVGSGTVWVSIALASLDALVPCVPDKILNRYVRPLLRAMTKCGALAHYFGRDWISVGHRPAAAVSFAHDRASGRAHVEAFVAVSTPFAFGARASFLGKEPGTLDAIVGRAVDPYALKDAVFEAYAPGAPSFALSLSPLTYGDDLLADPPWAAVADEAIGLVGAGPDAAGRFRVGGDLLVSRDALAALEGRITDPSADVARAVDETLGAPGVALDGVRSLTTIADVIRRARGA